VRPRSVEASPESGSRAPDPTPRGVEICPGPAGAKEWPHAAYHPGTGLLLHPVVDTCGTFKLSHPEFVESMSYWGGDEGEEDQIGKPGAAVRSWWARHAVEAACRTSLRVGWRREHGLERAGVLWLREAS